MPAEEDDIIVESREILSDSETCNHGSHKGNKYKKIFHLFRGNNKEHEKSKTFESVHKKKSKKDKKKKCCNSDERKELFKKNMEESWTELPNTLKRKKEKISEEILSEFHDSETNETDSSSLKSAPSDHFLKKSKEKEIFKPGFSNIRSYILGDIFGNDSKETCDCGKRKSINEENGGTSEDDNKLMENGQLSLEKIRKLTEDDYETEKEKDERTEDRKSDKKSDEVKEKDLYLSEVTDDVITSLFYDVILEKSNNECLYENTNKTENWVSDTQSEVDGNKSAKSDTYVSQSIIFETHPIIHYSEESKTEEKKEQEGIERSNSSDSLLNESSVGSSSASEVGHHDDSGTDVACESPSKQFKEMLSNFERISSENSGKIKITYKKKSNSLQRPTTEFTCADEINTAIMKLRKISRSNENVERSNVIVSDLIDNGDENKPAMEVNGKQCSPKTDEKKEGMQYSDIVFNTPSNNSGFFINKDFKQDADVDSLKQANHGELNPQKNSPNLDYQLVTDHKIVYQELNFSKNDGGYEEVGERNKHIYEEPKFGKEEEGHAPKTLAELKSCFESPEPKKKEESGESAKEIAPNSNHMTEEEKAKKKSAEAIAKELSSQIFSKRNLGNKNGEEIEDGKKHRKEFLKSIGYDIPSNNAASDNAKKNASSEYVQMKCGVKKQAEVKTQICNECNSIIESKEEEKDSIKLETQEQEIEKVDEAEMEGEDGTNSDLQYFSVADWRKAVAMGSKRGINSAAMETIVEEPETDTATKLTVREILRRFEELGNKQFSEKFFLSDEERTATLKQIHQTLKCLEEKVRSFEKRHEEAMKQQQSIENSTSGGWTGKGPSQRISQSTVRGEEDENVSTSIHDGKHSLLQFAIHHFRQSPEKFEMLKTSDGSISGSLKVIESKNKKNKEKGKGSGKDPSEWTWKEQVDLVKFTPKPIEQSLLRLDTPELSDLAVECFVCLMRYMGDLPMPTDVSEVKCVYTILMHCHKYEQLRDEVYCQLMKQTTNNKSAQPESCQRGWRLFSIVAAYFVSSDVLKPFLFKYLETAAYDKRRAYHGTATVCLQNLRKTFKYGGRKNVPSVEEITAISAGRNSKRQIYRLPGGTEKVVNTKSTTVVQDVIEELCIMINVTNPQEMEEFSVYCIVEGDTFTMPLAREEYILDVTTELHKNHQVFYLIFCRSVWYFPLRLDSQLYVEVVFNQIAPDYLEGLLLVMPGESLEQDVIYDIAKIAALLHRAADMTHLPSMKETKFLLPKPALAVRDVKPSQWVNMVQSNWQECEGMTTIQAKAQVLDVLSKWPLFGSSFFAVKKASEPKERTDHILALNRNGVHFIDLVTHETLLYYPFSEVISTRKVKSEDGTLFLDMKCGNLMQQRITRLQTDQAHEISRLIRQYITMQQRLANQM